METRAADLARACSGRREVERRSTASSGTPAGPTSCRRCSAARTPSPGPYFNFTVPEPTGVVAILAPDEPALDGLVSRIAPGDRERERRGRRRVRDAPARRDRARRGDRDLRRARRRRQPPHRASAPSSRPMLASHMDVNAIDLTGAGGETAELERARRRQRQARRAGRQRAEPVGDLGLPRAEDRLAPGGPEMPRWGAYRSISGTHRVHCPAFATLRRDPEGASPAGVSASRY